MDQGIQPQQVTKKSEQAATLAFHQTFYPSLEEKVAPAIIGDYASKCANWVHETEFQDSQKLDLQQDNLEQEVQRTITFDVASDQPANYTQSMGTQYILSHDTNPSQHGHDQVGPNQINMSHTNLVQQHLLNLAQINPTRQQP